MARLTHLARERDQKRIVRNGIKPPRRAPGVFAMPVLPDFYASHQWLRELRGLRGAALVAVDFVIDDDEPVLVGHYSDDHVATTAARAAHAIMHAEDARGFEVIVPRKIDPKEIRRVRHVPQVVGWRHWPDSHGRPPCPCDYCQYRRFGAAKIRGRL